MGKVLSAPMYTPPPLPALLDSITPAVTLSLAPACATAPPNRDTVLSLVVQESIVSAPKLAMNTAPPSLSAVFSLSEACSSVWLPAATNIAPPRPGTVEPQPLASLLDNVDDVTVICAPRGEFTSAEVDAGMTKIAPPVGAVFLRTIVEPSIASFVGAFSVFGTSAKAPPPTAYNERQLEPLTAELDSISDASLT